MPPQATTRVSGTEGADAEYRVLARKYRPKTFNELVGHETLVRTLTNAFSSGRIAHAFMLTGVRGIGKTTTARLIARALNCIGADGLSGPTMNPCGVCEPCLSITGDRHPDVIEMDAASRTGVDDIRELIEGVRYRPVSARYKVYIIDEVHMLSRQAFNALLKTLEEPPPDIKFVFATTEINKVPITVLSRCQRYTLPRLPASVLAGHYRNIAASEKVVVEEAALALIARAADGSVRDGLSILDQAIALGLGGIITADAVRDMLGIADRGLVYDLFDGIMQGDASASLSRLEGLYNGGADPAMVIQELLEITHTVTRCKLEPPGAGSVPADDEDRQRGHALASRLGIAVLSRTWQILLKGLAEVQAAPHPLKAAEMVIVRLVYVTDLPPPGEIVKLLRNGGIAAASAPVQSQPAAVLEPRGPEPAAVMRNTGSANILPRPQPIFSSSLPLIQDFRALAELIAEHREGILHALVYRHVRLVRFAPGHLEFQPTEDAPRDLSTRLSQFLMMATGQRWMISVSRETGQPTLLEQEQDAKARQRAEVEADPLVRAVLERFPGAVIERIVDRRPNVKMAIDIAAVAELVADVTPTLYEEDDPGPFQEPGAYDSDEDSGEEI